MSKISSDIEILELIHQYKEHECLWNIYSPDYKDKPLKNMAWSDIANFFHKTPNEVKRKMQYLRAAYVHEKKRVHASKNSDNEAIHEPVLFYYKEMDFLDNIVIWRKFDDSKDTSKISSKSIGSSEYFEVKELSVSKDDDIIQDPFCKSETFDESYYNDETSSPVSRAEPQSSAITKKNDSTKVELNKSSSSTIKPEIKSLYYSFGKTIALQLQQLPLEDALVVLSEIQSILTMKRLEHIRNVQNDCKYNSQSETEEL